MPEFSCRVGTPEGSVVTRTLEAADEAAARAELARQGVRVFSLRAAEGGRVSLRAAGLRGLAGGLRGGGRVKIHEFLVFNQELVPPSRRPPLPACR